MNDTFVPLAEAGVAAAGFAIAHLLSAPPDERVLELLAGDRDRQSWPTHNGPTDAALDVIAQGFEPEAVRTDWALLLGNHPDAVELRESRRRGLDPDVLGPELEMHYASAGMSRTQLGQRGPDHLGVELAYLAHLTAQLARAVGEGADEVVRATGSDLDVFRREHVDTFSDQVLDELGERARTTVLRAVPGLTVGFLTAVNGLIAAAASITVADRGAF